ncbi:hypothetical protein FNT36_23540 [Hymenobacter setariae]|uniref:Lipocalin-like domain-containing protein n=1 Tax=Hymenobacter setariae TaxID=2594794 RepID=A0A558BLJ6_9BACT|nr:hypothetical protein [Hymenobacter setariae]TVT37378.1 hypothetical protein FNT36_23540 [Hymenobacter setariae]
MQYTSYCALATLLAVGAACQKASVSPAATDQRIVGEWHWVSSMGGISGKQNHTPASTGSTDTWVLKADSTYQRRTTQPGGAQTTETGTFSLGSIKSIYTGQPARALTLRSKQPQTFVVLELTPRLVLGDNYYDGFAHTYER